MDLRILVFCRLIPLILASVLETSLSSNDGMTPAMDGDPTTSWLGVFFRIAAIIAALALLTRVKSRSNL